MTSDPNQDKQPSSGGGKNPRLEQGGASDESIQDVHATLLREKEEPSEGYPRMPLFVVFLFSGLILFSSIYMAKFGGHFDPMVYDETHEPGSEPEEPEKPADPLVVGERMYRQQCLACHQANGEGVSGAFPPLNQSDWATGSKARVVRIVLHGLQGEIEVRGETYNGVMPAFGNLDDDEIAAVLSYVRQEWDNDASEITPEEVAEIRSEAGSRGAWSAGELEEFAE